MQRRLWAALIGCALLGWCCADRPPTPKWLDSPSEPPRGAAGAASLPVTAEDQAGDKYPAGSVAPPPVDPPTGKGLELSLQRYIVVDQFGYRPQRPKTAILVDPVAGWNAADSYSPPPELEVRNWVDAKTVFRGKPTLWQAGAVDPHAGDRGSWFDFSAVTQPGLYYVYDPATKARSHGFEVRADVYRPVLRAAMKMFYFNRANVAKAPPHACVGKRCWSARADNVGAGQDREARSVSDRDNPRTARDLSGGWWDAGDTNKYVTFTNEAVHQLLTAYSEKPAVFRDDFGIPESANGVPDLIDELLVELGWLKKMQPADLKGGVLLKLGNTEYGNPLPEASSDKRYYYPAPCSSAAIVTAGLFAHAALVLKTLPSLEAEASGLASRAQSAWSYYHAHPRSDACDDGTIKSGDADLTLEAQDQVAVTAAVYLFALTGDATFDAYVAKKYEITRPFKDDLWSVYSQSQGDALLYFATLPNANSAAKQAILARKRSLAQTSDIYGFAGARSLYRSYMRKDMFHWASNNVRASVANTNYDMVQYGFEPARSESYVERAESLLHSFHGVNAMQIVYLTNMYANGAEACADETYHAWFKHGDPKWGNARTSSLGPAPGYLTGGPNLQYCAWQNAAEHACARSPVRRQPAEKAYVDTSRGYEPDNAFDKSWELTEPAIYYQASYVRLVSKFVD
jgi:hypothetical protein